MDCKKYFSVHSEESTRIRIKLSEKNVFYSLEAVQYIFRKHQCFWPF